MFDEKAVLSREKVETICLTRTHPFELLLVGLFKSNSLGSIHLSPPVERNLDIA